MNTGLALFVLLGLFMALLFLSAWLEAEGYIDVPDLDYFGGNDED